MKLAIFGSRGLNDERVSLLIHEAIEKYNPECIVTSGEPDGVCKLARDIAREKAISLHLHFLNFKYLRGAYEHRSIAVYNDCDHCLLIHDGQSQGTANELAMAKKMKIKHTYIKLEIIKSKQALRQIHTEDWPDFKIMNSELIF